MNERQEKAEGQVDARWREDFPVGKEDDQYVGRREFAKTLTIGSVLLALVNGVIAAYGRFFRKPSQMSGELEITRATDVPTGGSVLFRYPTDEDPCILLRTRSGSLRAYSQICTHLSCAVVHAPEQDELVCPCHKGRFDANDGRPLGGPPLRRLPRVWIEERGGGIVAVGRDR
jgi:arsenite oxidase small subunit